MNVKAELKQMNACSDAIDWIGNRTIEQAWRECRRSDWMLWLLRLVAPNDHRCRLAAADFAERVWNLIDNEPARRAAAWAIGAARRGDADEMLAAAAAAFAAAYAAYGVSASAAYSAAHAVVSVSASAAASAAVSASNAASADAAADAASYAATYAATYAAERAAQADILRGYFTPREIAKLLDAAIAKEGER